MKNIGIELTALEQQVLEAYISGLYAEPGFSDVDVNDLAAMTKISTKTIRGALSSLVKKGIVTVNDNGAGYQIIDLNVQHWHLVNESWAQEAEFFLNRNK